MARVSHGAGLNMGCYDLAVACFVFNYVSIEQTRKIIQDVYQLLKPGGEFVFSVPHPFMLFAHNDKNSKDGDDDPTFYFRDTESIEGGRYFSLKDRLFEGVIKIIDGKNLNVSMMYKTLEDYFNILKMLHFEIVDVVEAKVKSEHLAHNPQFSVKDSPLHLVFNVRKPLQVTSCTLTM
jgi:SAM-dependent methyltransferase